MKNRLLAATAALATLVLFQPYRPFLVSGTSMSPTFSSGQLLFGDTRPDSLVRGDVVVFKHNGETMVKRVAYLPGDSIERFWFADEWKIPTSRLMRRGMARQGLPHQRCTVPAGHVYVLADNPFGSVDSRTLGAIPVDEVRAVVPNVDPRAEWTFEGARLGAALVARL